MVEQLWNQADMCMIVRTMLASAKFPNVSGCATKPDCKQRFECSDFTSCSEDFPNPTNEFKIAEVSDVIEQL